MFFFNDTATTEIYTLSYTTLFRSLNKELISRRILITKPELNGKTLAQLKIRNNFGASITRVNRSGVDLVATPQLQLQMGDRVTIVGTELAVSHTEKVLGNSLKRLNHRSEEH